MPGSGQEPGEGDYPAGPTGVTQGSLLGNFRFDGYVDSQRGLGIEFREELWLSDFYNPTGRDRYALGDAFPLGHPRPRALLINIGALWCGPCKEEAEDHLPALYSAYEAAGLEILTVIAEGNETGTPAVMDDLDIWCQAYVVNYPAVIDRKDLLAGPVDQTFPVNILVDTRTMTIVDLISGPPDQSFEQRIDALLHP